MNLDDFIITCFYQVDGMMSLRIKDQWLHAHGPVPKLSNSDVITL